MLSVDSAELRPVRADLALHFEYESLTPRLFVEEAYTLERSACKYRDRVNGSMSCPSLTIIFYRIEFICVNRSLL